MLFLSCWIFVLRSTLSIIPCSSTDFTQKSVLVLLLFVSWVPIKSCATLLSVETPLVCGVPQGSGLCPFPFSLYTKQSAELIQKFCTDYQFFADDSELYPCLPTERESALRAIGNVESCCHEIKRWMMKNTLKLNEQKIDVLLCGPPSRRESVPVEAFWLAKLPFHFSSVVKTLGVTLDAALSFDQRVLAVVRSCFFHVRSLSKVRSYLTRKAANSIAVSLILSKLSCCRPNSLSCWLAPNTD